MKFVPTSLFLFNAWCLVGTSIVPHNDYEHQSPLIWAADGKENVREALKDAGLIPDVFDDFVPTFSLEPYYPKKQKAVDLGNHLKPKHVKHRPDIYADVTQPSNTTYTLVLSDPDALSHASPVKAQMCHWIVTNLTIPVPTNGDSDFLGLNIGQSRPPYVVELEPYFAPSPPPKTGLHRYVFALLASKPNSTAPAIPKRPKQRPHWGYGKIGAGIREWASENELDIVGVNFFYSQNKKQ